MLQTPAVIPAIDERSRFGTVSFGYDRLATIRAEHSLLAEIAALVLSRPVDELTVKDLEALRNDLQAGTVAVVREPAATT